MMTKKFSLNMYVASMLSALTPALAQASSFQILEQSPAHLGKAFAGTASDVRDASSVFFNPAGIVKLESANVTVGANGIFTNAEFNNRNSNTNGIEDKTDKVGLVPNIYWTPRFQKKPQSVSVSMRPTAWKVNTAKIGWAVISQRIVN